MSDVKWTDEQKKVINSLGGSMIVSAAAGSGKTAVLVERIINRICRSEKPCSVTDLLVVTFTRAAADEMRVKLARAIKEEVEKQPDNRFLQRQSLLLPLADICTIDSFFNKLVKDNCGRLDISPDYRILDESEINAMSHEAAQETLEKYYAEENENFSRLLDILGCDKSDENLVNVIFTLSRYSSAYPVPEKWLRGMVSSYDETEKPQDIVFGKVILQKISDYLDYAEGLLREAYSLVQNMQGLESVGELVYGELTAAEGLSEICASGEWNKLKTALDGVRFERFPTVKKDFKDLYEKKRAQLLRDKAKKTVQSLSAAMPADESEFSQDARFLKPVVKKLVEIVFEYSEVLSEKKRGENAYDFNDILHFALKLLSDENSSAAAELRKKYKEILIDEYQDTNEAQDAAFCAASDNMKNLFLVGDVKQSIYRFRLAMPQVFLGRMNEWSNSENEYPMCVRLGKNFRSRKDILNAVNYIFKKVMSPRTGDMVYDEREFLKAGAQYPEKSEPSVEMDILDKSQTLPEYTEMHFVADRIEGLLKSGMTVMAKDGNQRRISRRDICVLLRSKKAGPLLAEALRKKDIPAYYEENRGFFENTEVSVILSFLEILDNPLQDVPLLSVLMSPIFGFTADDVSEIRIGQRKGRLFYAVRQSENEKARIFISKYNEYRRLSTALDVQSLIEEIYEQSGYPSIVSALSNGEIRRLNLMLLLKYAEDYESCGRAGLPGFIRYINRLKESESDLKPAAGVSEYADVVRIMTVHKSKGLEFPVVILADTGRKGRNSSDDIAIHEKTGAGLKICDKRNFKKFSTVQYEASKTLSNLSGCSEELRILYVAMTRAKEKLIITAELDNLEKSAAAASCDCSAGVLHSVAVEGFSSYISLIMAALMRHPDAQKLRKYAGYDGAADAETDFRFELNIITDAATETHAAQEEKAPVKADAALVNEIKARAEYEYPYGDLSLCATKKSASSFNEDAAGSEFFFSASPSFTEKAGLTAAQRGTAVHRFMEVCDFSLAEAELDGEIARLLSENKITPEQARVLPKDDIKRFFDSELYGRIKKSERVMREKKFTVFIPLSFADPERFSEYTDEKILVQGVIDCAFYENGKAVVLDYKTDRIKDASQLAERYRRQLEIYKIAAEQTFGVEVSELVLYSFSLGEEITIPI